ncbi:MAG: pyruvate kinase [Candidatus Lokiarchaeota archaeon]|nr:pyruvate kinase [Candidatus Lokiarchaeota archaeon]
MTARKSITKSKIVCTLGPASSNAEMIKALSDRGMDVARLNFSHGTLQDKEALFQLVRKVDPTLAIMADIQGPKIRIGRVEGDGVYLNVGQKLVVTTEDVIGNKERVTINLTNLPNEAKPGDPIFINDGLIRLQVDRILNPTDIDCTVMVGGIISSKKGVNLPNTELSVRVPTPKDVEDLKLIARLDPEYVAISFVQDASDMKRIKNMLKEFGNENIKLIAKIERPLALKNIDEILRESDGFMVARGDLGVEVPFEKLIPAQKMLIKKANISGKPVIVATQMLESMISAPVPTRAEVSDVYNAVEDGADAVMLSAETAAGKFPRQAVEAMERVIKVSEDNIPPRDPDIYDSGEENLGEVIGHLVHATGKEFRDMYFPGSGDDIEIPNVKILVLTHSGLSARMVSKYRPIVPIIAATSSERSARELRLIWGVEPLLIPGIDDEANSFYKIQKSTSLALAEGFIEEGDTLVIAGNMNYIPAKTNMLVIFKVKDIISSMKDPAASP